MHAACAWSDAPDEPIHPRPAILALLAPERLAGVCVSVFHAFSRSFTDVGSLGESPSISGAGRMCGMLWRHHSAPRAARRNSGHLVAGILGIGLLELYLEHQSSSFANRNDEYWRVSRDCARYCHDAKDDSGEKALGHGGGSWWRGSIGCGRGRQSCSRRIGQRDSRWSSQCVRSKRPRCLSPAATSPGSIWKRRQMAVTPPRLWNTSCRRLGYGFAWRRHWRTDRAGCSTQLGAERQGSPRRSFENARCASHNLGARCDALSGVAHAPVICRGAGGFRSAGHLAGWTESVWAFWLNRSRDRLISHGI